MGREAHALVPFLGYATEVMPSFVLSWNNFQTGFSAARSRGVDDLEI